jgi:hypothetical protein
MLRLLVCIILTSLSSFAFAEGPPTLFEPAPNDVSIYYLGEIFGPLVPGGAETYLLSNMFEIFNLICLVVAIIIIIYTAIVAVLQTAGQGKVLGEKWSATFLPIRIVLGIALLIPTPGTGYVLSQTIVMWMALQGVGGADQLWNAALDYFIEGGAVFSRDKEATQSQVKSRLSSQQLAKLDAAGINSEHMTKTNLESTYELERVMLVNATCVEAHNRSDASKLMGKYEIYQTKNPIDGFADFVNFGNPDAWNDGLDGGNNGRECGHIIVPSFVADTLEQAALMAQTYSDAFFYMARGLRPMAEFLASERGADPELWDRQFVGTQYEATAFIEYLNAASHILYPDKVPSNPERDKLETLKDYGWILAGNYYMTLTSLKDILVTIPISINAYDAVKYPPDSAYDQYPQALKNAEDYWEVPTEDPRFEYTFLQWENLYVIPGYGDVTDEPVEPDEKPTFTYKDLHFIEHSLTGIGNMANVGSISDSGQLSTVNKRDPLFYLQELTNFGGTRGGDPIRHAAEFGGKLTEMAVAMLLIGMLSFLVITGFAAISGPCMITTPVWPTLSMLMVAIIAPFVFGVAGFMYVQGALLSVALPLIPFVIFFIAAIGWFIATIEMVVSAPLVAVGLVFPETNQDIWGKAQPAFMMILNLFLRPPLIILGFVAGMILTWVAIELLNAVFYLFLKDAAKIENMLFGWLVVIMTYVYLLIALVEKTFSITTELPNKVLLVLGDRSQAQPGAEATLSGMKQGVEKGSAAVGGFMTTAGGVAERGVSTGIGKSSQYAQDKKMDDLKKTMAGGAKKEVDEEGKNAVKNPNNPNQSSTPPNINIDDDYKS